MPTNPSLKKIFILAGEASGDLHGANLIRHLTQQSKEKLLIYGVGGDRIKETGALGFYDLAHFHVTGITAAIRKIPTYQKAAKIILERIQKANPSLVILIDNPGFNLHLAKSIHKMGIPMVYFIAPQVWAWAPERVLKIKKYIRKVLVVFQFEKKFFEANKVPVSWVGHPLKDLVSSSQSASDKENLITLMPGSRKTELQILLPILLKTAEAVRQKCPNATFQLIKAPTFSKEFYEKKLKESQAPIQLVCDQTYDAIAKSKLVIACSGTATLECAILGVPAIVINKGSLITYVAAKSLIKVKFIGLPNLILGQKRFPELLQFDATPQKISAEVAQILSDEKRYRQMKKDCAEVSRLIGEPGASARAASEILDILNN